MSIPALPHLANFTAEKLTPEKGPFGPLLESFVLGELDKQNRWSEGRYSFSHFRDKDGAEVDIVVENHEGRIAGVEVKAAATVGRRDFAELTKLAAAAGGRFAGGVVLYDGEQSRRSARASAQYRSRRCGHRTSDTCRLSNKKLQ